MGREADAGGTGVRWPAKGVWLKPVRAALLPAALPWGCAAPTPAASWMKAGLRLRMSRKDAEP